MARVIYVNGAFVDESDAKVSVFDRGFLFGDGIYEVSAVIDGRLVDNDLHLARLERSVKEIDIALPVSLDDIRKAQIELIRRNTLREGVTINLGSRKGRGVTKLGNNCFLMAGSHIGHDCHVGNNVTMANGAMLGGHFDVGDGVIMGGLAAGQQFGRIGRYAFISGLSGISTDVIPYGIAIGLHVRLGGLNLVGLRRRNIPRPSIHALRAAYRAIFLEGKGSIQDNAREAETSGKWKGIAEVEEVIAFILADAKRPITPARRRGEAADGGEA